MPDIILKAEGLHKSYGNLEIIKGLDFKISEGESTSIVGKSGSGKSTLLSLLALLERKDGGKIYYYGKDSDTFTEKEICALRKHTIGFVFQNSLLFEDFSAKENVMLSLSVSGVRKKEAEEKAEQVLSLVDLKDRMNHRPRELSGGERQRAAIARALAPGASLLFLDEPTGSLDEEAKENVESLLFNPDFLSGRAFIIVTHDEELASRTEKRYTLRGGILE